MFRLTKEEGCGDEAPGITEIRLDVKIAPETVGPIVKVLQEAEPGAEILLYMRHNGGGDVQQMFLLIGAITNTRANVTITFGRYVMSAAATLWLWFLLWRSPHVQSVPPRKPAVLMYHRPRSALPGTGRHCFAEDFAEADPRREPLEKKVEVFDALFEDFLLLLGWDPTKATPVNDNGVVFKHELHHLRDAYYGNKDCVIPVNIDR